MLPSVGLQRALQMAEGSGSELDVAVLTRAWASFSHLAIVLYIETLQMHLEL